MKLNSNQEKFTLWVKNNGPFIQVENQEDLFIKNFSTKKEKDYKRGQGLYITKHLVEQGQGHIFWKNLKEEKEVLWYVEIPNKGNNY